MNEVPLTFWQHVVLVVAPYVGVAIGLSLAWCAIRLGAVIKERRHG